MGSKNLFPNSLYKSAIPILLAADVALKNPPISLANSSPSLLGTSSSIYLSALFPATPITLIINKYFIYIKNILLIFVEPFSFTCSYQ